MNVKTWEGVKMNNFPYIQRSVERAGFPARTYNDVLAAVATLYTRYASRKVAEIVGVSDMTIRLWLHAQQIALRGKGGCRRYGKPVEIHGERRLFREWFPPDDWTREERRIIYLRLIRDGKSLEETLTTPLVQRKRLRERRAAVTAAEIAKQREIAQKWQQETYEE